MLFDIQCLLQDLTLILVRTYHHSIDWWEKAPQRGIDKVAIPLLKMLEFFLELATSVPIVPLIKVGKLIVY